MREWEAVPSQFDWRITRWRRAVVAGACAYSAHLEAARCRGHRTIHREEAALGAVLGAETATTTAIALMISAIDGVFAVFRVLIVIYFRGREAHRDAGARQVSRCTQTAGIGRRFHSAVMPYLAPDAAGQATTRVAWAASRGHGRRAFANHLGLSSSFGHSLLLKKTRVFMLGPVTPDGGLLLP